MGVKRAADQNEYYFSVKGKLCIDSLKIRSTFGSQSLDDFMIITKSSLDVKAYVNHRIIIVLRILRASQTLSAFNFFFSEIKSGVDVIK